jgi:DNA repair exonuclease SbcCD ATPase subunit
MEIDGITITETDTIEDHAVAVKTLLEEIKRQVETKKRNDVDYLQLFEDLQREKKERDESGATCQKLSNEIEDKKVKASEQEKNISDLNAKISTLGDTIKEFERTIGIMEKNEKDQLDRLDISSETIKSLEAERERLNEQIRELASHQEYYTQELSSVHQTANALRDTILELDKYLRSMVVRLQKTAVDIKVVTGGVIAVAPYVAKDPSHITIKKGDKVEIIKRSDVSDLWIGRVGDKRGMFHRSCVDLDKVAEQEKAMALKLELEKMADETNKVLQSIVKNEVTVKRS